jgi:putative FmdB family regulatory protein
VAARATFFRPGEREELRQSGQLLKPGHIHSASQLELPCNKAPNMPFFDYQCLSCDHTFEVMQKASDPAPEACPSCHEGKLKKLLSAPAIQSSGGGGGGGHVHGPGCRH